ncbi:exported hypothetical protein [Nitrolancea hollandica Lb]|uniref:Uncharacterized protein n=1 Tax=Nitrolancea hollandica Lb TaxID=1129897 RepID=I4EME6_9BACT|nr:exported hypothetical protein [Nitrolancea hollandica Lb]
MLTAGSRYYRWVALGLALFLLAACGSGRSGLSTPTPVPSPSGSSAPSVAPSPSPSASASSPSPTLAPSSSPSPSASPLDPASPEAAVQVIRVYYQAINEGDFERAYHQWGDGGAASNQTLDQFRRGFDQTDHVVVEIGQPGRIEGAAGSRYIEIPVTITATMKDGQVQHFSGSYTLRRSVVEGATPEQQTWRFYTAHIVPTDAAP